MNEDELNVILLRLEKKAAEAAKLRHVEEHNQRLDHKAWNAQRRIETLENDLRTANDKIAEWLAYCEQITALVPRAKRKALSPVPKPIDDIPF